MKKYKLYIIFGFFVAVLLTINIYMDSGNQTFKEDGYHIENNLIGQVNGQSETDPETDLLEKSDSLKDNKGKKQVIVDSDGTDDFISREIVDMNDPKIGKISPERIVLTPGADATSSMGITFNLDFIEKNTSVLVFNEGYEIIGEYHTEISEFFIDSNGSIRPVFTYKSMVKDIESGNIYYMIKTKDGFSDIFSVELPSKEGPTTIAFFGDTQGYLQDQYDDFSSTYEHALEVAKDIDINYIAGDLVDTGDNWAQWMYFNNAMNDVLQGEIFVTAIGNHDVINGSDIYTNTFNYPKNGVEGLSERTYYYDIPFARIGVWDTEKPSMFVEQRKWLQEIMQDSDAEFKIVLMHRSCYPAAYDEEYIRNLGGVFEDRGIDLVLSGHDHIYSRTTMNHGERVADGEGVTYIVGGSSTGSKYYELQDVTKRYWIDKVYDDNNPVFTIVTVEKTQIGIEAYAVIEGQSFLIDEVYIE